MKKIAAFLMASAYLAGTPAYAAPAESLPAEVTPAPAQSGAETEVSILEPSVSAECLIGSVYAVRIRNAGMVSSVRVACWSEANGQDDLIWYDARRGDDGVWSAEVDTAAHGGCDMIAHAYAGGELLGGASFETPVPDRAGLLAVPGFGGLPAVLVSSLYGASSVQAAVWSEDCGQEDLVWYDGLHRGGGTWKVMINPALHSGGKAVCHIYADGALVDGMTLELPRNVPSVKTELRGGMRYDVVIENVWGSGVQVPTWGEAGGQDDIIWYRAARTGPGTWRASINAASHDTGSILSHVYADGRGICDNLRISRDFLSVHDASGSSADPDLDALSRKLDGWGPGNATDRYGRPESCTDYQNRFGKYDADFIAPQSGKIFLTFDEGYENGYTASILDTLRDRNVKAVFFVTAPYVRENPELVRRMIREGHQVGNHSANHRSFPSLSNSQAMEEVMSVHRMLQRDFDYDMHLFRFPSGEFSERDLALLKTLGYRSAFWSFAYRDWEPASQIGAAAALKKMKQSVHGGAIYLLHAVSRDNAAVLGEFIDYCREQGYELAPYGEF
ncbi:MAG: polysaccharide deacetylase family protein [Clostridia bacterium]|nr:polysaccharide deacetylase family protein [Clostridia bacterium]